MSEHLFMPNDSGMQNIDLSLPGNSLAVRAALEEILKRLKNFGFSKDNCGVAELVLAEVMNNIVEHAYSIGDPGPINIRISRNEMCLLVKLVDHGDPMPRYSLPQTTLSNLDCALDDLPEGGWGWLIIHEIAEDLLYRRVGQENHLSFKLSDKQAFKGPASQP